MEGMHFIKDLIQEHFLIKIDLKDDLLKIPIALLRRINVRIIIFLDDMLVMAQTLKEISQAKETLIFLLQNLGFVINFKKSQLGPVKEIECFGLVIY